MRDSLRLSYVWFALALAVPVEATTYVVRPDGGGDFPTIQEAIDAAVDGDVIELTEGVFRGDGNRNLDYLGKAITVRSTHGDPTRCVIDCEGDWNSQHRGVVFQNREGASSILEGITIRNGFAIQTGYGGALRCVESGPTIRNCILAENVSHRGGAAYGQASLVTFESCIIRDNLSYDFGGSMYFRLAAPRFLNCTFAHNTAAGGPDGVGGALYLEDTAAFVSNCIVYENDADSVIGSIACASSSVVLECCDVFGNTEWPDEPSDWVSCIADQENVNGNFSADPHFCSPIFSNPVLHSGLPSFSLKPDSPCAPGNHPNGDDCGLIGALGIGCASTPGIGGGEGKPPALEETTWGRIRAGYR
jgi:hypothetical protein